MASLAQLDGTLIAQLDSSTAKVRSVMLFARRMREGDYVIDAGVLKLIEDWLFITGMELEGLRNRSVRHLAEYRHIAEAALDAFEKEDPAPLPPFCNLVVFTGSYRPVPANDQMGGAA